MTTRSTRFGMSCRSSSLGSISRPSLNPKKHEHLKPEHVLELFGAVWVKGIPTKKLKTNIRSKDLWDAEGDVGLLVGGGKVELPSFKVLLDRRELGEIVDHVRKYLLALIHDFIWKEIYTIQWVKLKRCIFYIIQLQYMSTAPVTKCCMHDSLSLLTAIP